ncbi:hypothetical protein GCWU000325_00846 [Alloprevotella tannerae ATCC 51259]|uniref:Uncharacterized protein n=1 Tax=Alloprevotella tannerae ATCC 51259 TaxID=626522 RepID=C9LF64_9BACT|nr:hypothetical protein GCWU000325_00846 [Alloprevotella tannerae ATCC 51259]
MNRQVFESLFAPTKALSCAAKILFSHYFDQRIYDYFPTNSRLYPTSYYIQQSRPSSLRFVIIITS